jgi:antitoxin (DNA-binding transcriptional repressor) of toxin-antitoxin stability system
MTAQPEYPEITQRELRSSATMDALEAGQGFTVTRDGHPIGRLVPIRKKRRWVSRAEFAAMAAQAPGLDAERFETDIAEHVDDEIRDPFDLGGRHE